MSPTEPISTHADFLTVPTRDMQAALAFYGETLGLPRSVYSERGYAEFETGNLTLGVVDYKNMGGNFTPNANPLALRVDDIEAARAQLEERGVEFKADTLDTSVCHMAFFADPDGNALMLHHRYAPHTP
jgi:predicted enzyme related to lactoylglutathione lyase